MSFPGHGPVPLEAVLCTEELYRRSWRAPNYAAESRALGELAQALADAPSGILQRMAEIMLVALRADSAGLSLLAADRARFSWPAIAGEWSSHIGESAPRDFGPCSDVLKFDAPLLFAHPERRYTYLVPFAPAMVECLLVPVRVRGGAVGAVWVAAHANPRDNEPRRFDAEDLRVLESLSGYAAAAYQMLELREGVEQRDCALRESHSMLMVKARRADIAVQSRHAALNLLEDALLARQAAERVNTDLQESEGRLSRQLAAMQQMQSISNLLIEGASDVDVLQRRIVDAAVLIMGSDGASFMILDEHDNALRLLASDGFDATFDELYARILPDSRSACGLAWHLHERVAVPETEAWDFIAGTPTLEHYRRQRIRAVQATPLLARSGELLGMLSTHWRTPHRPAEAELRSFDVLARQAADLIERSRAEDALRQSEARLRFMAESMPQKTFTASVTGEHSYLNQQWMEYAGLSLENMQGLGWRRLIHPDDLTQTLGRWEWSVATGEPFEVEHRCRRADGEFRWHLSRARAMRDPHENVAMWVGSSTDVHDVKEADRRKDEFLAMLAHELRNPLAPVTHAAHLLRQPDLDASTVALAVQVIGRQTRRMSRLIDDLLDVSRITRGMVELRRERIDLRQSIEAAVEQHEAQFAEKHQELQRPDLPHPIWIDADGVRIEQVISNLLSNATRYTPEGGRIEITVELEHEWVVLRVRDTGIGIPADVLPRIFELFSQENAAAQRDGLGIGLTVVRQLVELHGGKVMARSAGREQGTELVVRLPCVPDRTTAPGELRPPSGSPPGGGPWQRILVVEDNADAAQLLARLLESWGHDVSTVADGPAALDAAGAVQPHVILLDLGLPGMSGYEVAQKLRCEPGLAATRIVAITGFGQDEDRRRSREAGFDAHLVKPVSPDTLQHLLSRSDLEIR